MNRLWVKLTLAFAAVALMAVGVVAILAARTTGQEFQQYIVSAGMAAQTGWAEALGEYYAQHGSWAGVGDVLSQMGGPGFGTLAPGRGPGASAGVGRGRGAMGVGGPSGGGPSGGGPNWAVVDTSGHVVASRTGQVVGENLPTNVVAQGLPLVVNGQRVGTLLNVRPADVVLDAQAQSFLTQVRASLVWAGFLAVLLALVLGIVLSQRLAAPLVRLTHAATAIAGGDLQQQVPVTSKDEIGQLGGAFNRMAAGLAEADTLRRNMMADVAHELRTPLTVIQGNLQAILDGVFPLDLEQVAGLYDETRLLTRLVDDLRDLALAEAGQLRLEQQPVDLVELCQAAVTNFGPAAEASGVKLALAAAPDVPRVPGDADRLAQVLRNLIGNALRYTPPGGRIDVRLSSADGQVRLEVADTGSGIAPQDLAHVFDRFYRADKSRGRLSGGAGLGLAIVRQLVVAHGGEISVQSVPKEGTTFTIVLPTGAMPPAVEKVRAAAA